MKQTVIDLPVLLEPQIKSYRDFLQKEVPPEKRKYQGIQAAFLDVFGDYTKSEGILNSDGSVLLQFISYTIGEPKITPDEARKKGLTYSAPLKVKFRISKRLPDGRIQEISEQDVNLVDLPLMLPTGSFIINGTERCVVMQLHRAPGVIFEEVETEPSTSREGRKLFYAAIIPYRGAWIEFEYDVNDVLYAKLDRRKKVLSTVLLKALGLDTNDKIIQTFYEPETTKVNENIIGRYTYSKIVNEKNEVIVNAGEKITDDTFEKIKNKKEIILVKQTPKFDPSILYTLEKDQIKEEPMKEKALSLIFRLMKQIDIFITPQQAESYFNAVFLSTRFYDLTVVGRHKLNKKFEIIYEMEPDLKMPSERKKTLSVEDVICTIKYLMLLRMEHKQAVCDDIDHLGNKRVRCVGELVENQLKFGLYNMVRFARERLNTKSKALLTPRKVLNIMPVAFAIKKFFATSQLSQFMDQVNPQAELTHKRRLSALGPGGLGRKSASFEARDIHYTHYGRICPIETPEGQNIGLITSLASYARINDYGLIETPYRVVKNGRVTNEVIYLSADKEDEHIIAPADTPLDENNYFKQKHIIGRHKGEIKMLNAEDVTLMDVAPYQMFSVTTSLIPYLEHDDANRALMGSNMMRQAVPLLFPEKPLVATGFEKAIPPNIGSVIISEDDGEVIRVSADEVAIITKNDEVKIYPLKKYFRSNQDTAINFTPVVSVGQKVKKGDVIIDGPAVKEGELALGRNVLCAFLPFEGYNYEDAIVISERLVREDVFTSITIMDFEVSVRDTIYGPEEITKDIPNLAANETKDLDEEGIVKIGTDVSAGDILVGKIAPRGEEPQTPEEKLLVALFGKKTQRVKDVSLRVPPGVNGKVIDVQVITRTEKMSKKEKTKKLQEISEKYEKILQNIKEDAKKAMKEAKNQEELEKIKKYYQEKQRQIKHQQVEEQNTYEQVSPLPLTIDKQVKVYIAQIRKIQVGDKLAGRHGNKGVVAKILPIEDMPYLPDGTPIDVIFSPLCVPSRMNIGQLYELMMGWIAKQLNQQIIVPPMCGTKEKIYDELKKVKRELIKKGIPEEYLPTDDGKITLYDGRTGEPFHEKVFVGYMYLMKLLHMVEDKIHARSTGQYTLVTQQPVGGKARFGGQRFGEMEVWALEGYGAGYGLQEFLTIKSDDMDGRVRTYQAIIHDEIPSEFGTPESFRVLVHELRGLGLNIELHKPKKEVEAKLKEDKIKMRR